MAELNMNSLAIQDNVRDIRRAIQDLPRELDEIYDKAMDRIGSQDAQKSKRGRQVLSWIIYAVRPVTVSEIQHALAVEPEDTDLDEDALPDRDVLVSACAGLVTVDKESDIIRLVHYTTQRYFERVRENWFPAAQVEIARTCLTYLSFRVFSTGPCPNHMLDSRYEANPLLLYAATYWGEHVRGTAELAVKDLLLSFLKLQPQVSSTVQAMNIPLNPFTQSRENFRETGSALWLVAHHGLKDTVLQLLAEGWDIEARMRSGETVLHRASFNGHEQLVRLLLDHGADVNAQGGPHSTALHAAATYGNTALTTMLLDYGASIDA